MYLFLYLTEPLSQVRLQAGMSTLRPISEAAASASNCSLYLVLCPCLPLCVLTGLCHNVTDVGKVLTLVQTVPAVVGKPVVQHCNNAVPEICLSSLYETVQSTVCHLQERRRPSSTPRRQSYSQH